MANDAKKLAGVALTVLRLTRGKLGTGGVIGLVIAAVLYVAVLQPFAEKKLGLSLPTIGETASAPAERTRSGSKSSQSTTQGVEPGELSDILTDVGRGVFESPAGLRYTHGSQQGHRLKHVMAHAEDDPNRVGQHGVFDSEDPREVVLLIDQAYTQALDGRDTRTRREEGRVVYEVDLGRRIGYVGGQSGNRRGKPAADHLRLVVQENRLITAFPFKP